jgi:polygalacturonase
MLYSLVSLFVLFSIASAFPSNVTLNAPRKIGKRCTGTIQSLADVAAAELCTTINVCSCALAGLYVVLIDIPRSVALLYRQDVRTYIEAEAANLSHLVFFTETFALAPPDGATVTLTGQITFAFKVRFFSRDNVAIVHIFSLRTGLAL